MIFRASFSVLRLWEVGKYEEACQLYFHIPREMSNYVKEGIKYHKEWNNETLENKALPKVFGGLVCTDLLPEEKLTAKLDGIDWLEVVGVIDCLVSYDKGDTWDIIEYKTGVTNSQSYARTKQIGVYAILAIMNGRVAKRGIVMHFNQYTGKSDTSYVWITPKIIEETINWIVTISAEMKKYIEDNDLYNRFSSQGEEKSFSIDSFFADETISDVEEEVID
jgi:hypothetical protein